MHERKQCSMRDLEEYHSLDDLREMHLALDVIDDLAAAVSRKQKQLADEAKRQ